jgi:hypothetical protein
MHSQADFMNNRKTQAEEAAISGGEEHRDISSSRPQPPRRVWLHGITPTSIDRVPPQKQAGYLQRKKKAHKTQRPEEASVSECVSGSPPP